MEQAAKVAPGIASGMNHQQFELTIHRTEQDLTVNLKALNMPAEEAADLAAAVARAASKHVFHR